MTPPTTRSGRDPPLHGLNSSAGRKIAIYFVLILRLGICGKQPAHAHNTHVFLETSLGQARSSSTFCDIWFVPSRPFVIGGNP